MYWLVQTTFGQSNLFGRFATYQEALFAARSIVGLMKWVDIVECGTGNTTIVG